MDQSDQPQANNPQPVPPPSLVPATAQEEAGQDVGEAPNAEHTIDLEKELGEDIHLVASATPRPIPVAPVMPASVPPPTAQSVPSPITQPAPVAQAPITPVTPTPVQSVPVVTIPPIPVAPVATSSPVPTPAPVTQPVATAPTVPPKAATPARPTPPAEPRSAILPGVIRSVPDATTPVSATGAPVVDQLRTQSQSPLHPLRTMRTDEKGATDAAASAAAIKATVTPPPAPTPQPIPVAPIAPIVAPPSVAEPTPVPAPIPPSTPVIQSPQAAVVPPTPIPQPSAPKEVRPFVAPSAFKEIPTVPSAAPMRPTTTPLNESGIPPVTPPIQKSTPAVPHISVMHPEAIPGARPIMPPPQPIAPKKVAPAPVVAAVLKPKPIPENLPGVPKQASAPVRESISVDSPLRPLRTYKTDAEQSVKTNRTSVVSIAAAEERRRVSTMPTSLEVAPRNPFPWKRLVIGLVSLLFIVAGGAAVAYVVMGPPTINPPTEVQASTIMYVDGSTEVELQGLDHTALMATLTNLRDNAGLSLGLMRELFLTLPALDSSSSEGKASAKRLATTQEALAILSPNIPNSLSRALQPEFIMGAHVFDGSQGFIVLRTDAYQQAVAGMLEWEYAMRAELSPFLERRPRPRAPGESTNATTTPRVIASSFVDQTVRNHDARVLYNEAGDIILLYAFLDQRTIAITTNENTLFELATRLKDPLSSALRDIE